jgi:enoyl-CoA hydratase/carnithine racemase
MNIEAQSGSPTYETFDLVRKADAILVVKLNYPEALNSFTVMMANESVDLFTRVNGDDATCATVVTCVQ